MSVKYVGIGPSPFRSAVGQIPLLHARSLQCDDPSDFGGGPMLEARNLWELVSLRAAETPDARMLVDEGGRSLTFDEFERAAERAAAGLLVLGLSEGSVVSWQLPSWLESFLLVAPLS